MPAANLGPNHDLAKRLSALESAVQQLSTRDVLKNASIGSDGLVVNGGSITIEGGGSLIVTGGGEISVPTGTLNTGGDLTVGGSIVAGVNITADGTVIGGTVEATGEVYSTAPFVSPGSFAYHVVSGYKAMWINSDGTIGVSASNRASKRDLEPLQDLDPLMQLRPMLGRYKWDADSEPLRQFLIAEEVAEAGFGPDVAPLSDNGVADSVNYSQLVPALIAKVQELSARLDAAGL